MPSQDALFGDHGARCNVAISNNYDSCGSITRSNIAYATPNGLLTLFKSGDDYKDMQSLMTTNMELKACGTKTYGLYDWLMSSARPVGALVNQKKIQGTDSLMEPFILASQKSIINDDFWAVLENVAIGGYTTNTTTGNSGKPVVTTNTTYGNVTHVLRLKSRYGLDPHASYFVPGATLHVFGRTGAGAASRTQFIVAASANEKPATNQVATWTDVACVVVNNGDSHSHGGVSSGVAVIGANNVSDYESWCNNRPALNPNRVVPFWTQTSRYTLCVDEFYKEWFAKLSANNPYFAKFGDVTLAERNRQLGAMWQREWMNSFFWGKRFNTNQSLANWTLLPAQYAHHSGVSTTNGSLGGVTTSATSHVVSRKANAIGIYEQLHACSRVKDLKGQRLNLAELFNELYTLYRTRSNSGRAADSIDCYTDSKTAASIQTAMVKYYGAATVTANSNSAITFDYQVKDGAINKLGFRVRSYELLYPQGVTLNIITDHYFDDFVSAMKAEELVTNQHNNGDGANTEGASRVVGDSGRFLMFLDLGGGIYPGIVDSNRKVHTTGALEDLAKIDSGYGCVMRSPTKEVTLNSVTWTAVVECPDDNLIVENFDDAEPDTVVSSGDYTAIGGASVDGSETDLLSDDETPATD